MKESLPGIIAAFMGGAVLAWVNYRLTRKAAMGGVNNLTLIPLVRLGLSVGYLAAVFFAAPHTPWDSTWLLLAAVLGLTVPMFIYTYIILRQLNANGQTEEKKEGGDADG